MPVIAALPTAPARTQDSNTFITNADAFVAALPVFRDSLNTLATAIGVAHVDSDYASLNAAVTAIGSTPARLIISGTMSTTSAVVTPATLEVVVLFTGRIQNDHQITFNGAFNATKNQVFLGTGAILFGSQYGSLAVPQWWGVVLGDDVSSAQATANRAAINAAFASLEATGGGTVYFSAGVYTVNNQVGVVNGSPVEMSITVIAEPGAVLNCVPDVYCNCALRLEYEFLKYGKVTGLSIRCNDKTSAGLFLRSSPTGSTAVADLLVEHVSVCGCRGINNPSVTTAPIGIFVSSSGFGGRATVQHCTVDGVTRDALQPGDGLLSCAGIAVSNCAVMTVQHNTVSNVSHNSQGLQDADGIKVFCYPESDNYRKSVVLVAGNNMSNCDGRFIKLRTEGECQIWGNLITLNAAMTLIPYFKVIDSMVADARIWGNTINIGSAWSGGASAAIFALQAPEAANVSAAHEVFNQRVENNDISVKKQVPYFILPTAPAAGVTAVCQMVVRGNTGTFADSIMSDTNYAFSCFIYLNIAPTVANTTAQWVWDVSDNVVSNYSGIRLTVPQEDYAGKWFFRIYDNQFPPYGATHYVTAASTDAYTSTCMFRDNAAGAGYLGRVTWPIDVAKIMEGSDFYIGNQTMTNVPPSYTFSRIYRHGGYWGVQRPTGFYTSGNATTWTLIT